MSPPLGPGQAPLAFSIPSPLSLDSRQRTSLLGRAPAAHPARPSSSPRPSLKRRPRVTCATQQPLSTPDAVTPENLSSEKLLLDAEASAAADRRCGFAALLGPSNSGKSTLMNLLVGSKVAIVTPKVQTTRCRVAGIVVKDEAMTIFMDTPGVFRPTGRLDRAMVRVAWKAASSGDVVAIVLDSAQICFGGRRIRAEDDEVYISEAIQEVFSRVPLGRLEYCIVLNKIDTVEAENRDEFVAAFRRALDKMEIDGAAATVFPLSALENSGVDEFSAWVRDHMPPGPWLYPEDDLTDMPMRLIAAEVTREKIFMLLKQELPYEVTIETSSYQEKNDGSIRIAQDIFVNRSSQKKILTGQGGSMVKAIGIAARKELSNMTDCTVHLILTVKVREKWKEDSRSYMQWGLDYNA